MSEEGIFPFYITASPMFLEKKEESSAVENLCVIADL